MGFQVVCEVAGASGSLWSQWHEAQAPSPPPLLFSEAARPAGRQCPVMLFFFFALMYIYFSRTGPSWLQRGSLWLQSELLAARAGSVDPAQQLRPTGPRARAQEVGRRLRCPAACGSSQPWGRAAVPRIAR